MSTRIEQELNLLRHHYPHLEYRGEAQWVRFPHYPVPKQGGWEISDVAVAVQFPVGYPGQKPYGFHVSPPLELSNGVAVQNTTTSMDPPWTGPWQKFSWDPPEWHATEDVRTGSNMLNYVLTFAERLRQGA